MPETIVVGLSSYLPPHIRSCDELYRLRINENKYIGWASYISASLKIYGSKRYHVGLVILPSLCRRSMKLFLKDFETTLDVVELPTRKISRGLRDFVNYDEIAALIEALASHYSKVILHVQGLFSIHFARQLLSLYNKAKKIGNVFIVAQQQSSPPFMYYRESYPSMKTLLFSIVAEAVYRARKYLVDGYIVMNKKTYSYLLYGVGIEKQRVIYQHDGVDFDKVRPELYGADKSEDIWPPGCRHRLILISHVTRSFGGYTKGVTLLPRIARRLAQKGYRACISVVGDIIDYDLAQLLRRRGIVLTGHVEHKKALEYINSADIYILPAHSRRYYGGITVAVIEALALDKPVVSPTLEHVPVRSLVKYLGVETPWVTEQNLDEYIDALIYAIDNVDSFKPRMYARKIYDLRTMVFNIERLYDYIVKHPAS